MRNNVLDSWPPATARKPEHLPAGSFLHRPSCFWRRRVLRSIHRPAGRVPSSIPFLRMPPRMSWICWIESLPPRSCFRDFFVCCAQRCPSQAGPARHLGWNQRALFKSFLDAEAQATSGNDFSCCRHRSTGTWPTYPPHNRRSDKIRLLADCAGAQAGLLNRFAAVHCGLARD